jgi:hypothetical protein
MEIIESNGNSCSLTCMERWKWHGKMEMSYTWWTQRRLMIVLAKLYDQRQILKTQGHSKLWNQRSSCTKNVTKREISFRESWIQRRVKSSLNAIIQRKKRKSG